MIDLSTISTAELVAELSKRDGWDDVECGDYKEDVGGAGMTDELCPQFGIIGAACSDPETFCDQYVFCKRARELQKEPSTIPQWAIDAINERIDAIVGMHFGGRYANQKTLKRNAAVETMEWVLTLRNPENSE